ncbi:hypothetical protein ANRL4_02417 [Anaerolineae bacterium]|nr:hypothetical protein ANRL4_02417 [Anaerolineae bacterium]
MKQRVLILILAIVLPLLFTGVLLALASPWNISVSVDPAVVDLAQGQREATVTVALSRTESMAENVLIICSVQSGEVVTVSNGLYPLGTSSVIWVGDVLTDATSVFSFTVRPAKWPDTAVPCTLIESGLGQQVVTGTINVAPYRVWLPTTLKDYASPIEPTGIHTWTYPAENWLMQAAGSDLAGAVAGSSLLAWRYDRAAITINQPPSASGQPYYITRSMLSFDLTSLPAGKVTSAWLELYTYNTWYGRFDLKFERGLWARPPTIADWNAYGETLGVYDTGQWTTSTLSMTVPLSGLIGLPRPAELNLTLRGDETTDLPIGALQSLHTHIALQWPDNPLQSMPQLPTDTPISRLYLIIVPEATP